ncbi:peroxidase-related enzyme [Streptomyces sp. M19]
MRAEAAAHAAELTGQSALAAEYRALADSPAEPAASAEPANSAEPAEPLLDAVSAYTKAVTLTPSRAGRAHLEALAAAGLDTPRSSRSRSSSPSSRTRHGSPPDSPCSPTPPLRKRRAPRTRPRRRHRVHPRRPGVAPWVEAVAPDALDAEQRAVIDAHATLSTASPYYRTLLHDPAALDHRTHVYNAIMYGRGGLPRAERELATVLVSRGNGCIYCASVHGRKFAQLGRDEDAALRVLREGSDALADDPRRAAIGRFAERLTATPPATDTTDVAALRAAGLDDAELSDLVHSTALFGWANRLMQVLGEARPTAPTSGRTPRGTPAGRRAGVL